VTIRAVHAENGKPRTLPLSPSMIERLRAPQVTSTRP
jgi:hypothetical protein